MIANTLIHREFTSSYTAKFVIEKDRMYTENANRSSGDGIITPDNMEPNPKNPIIASFFRNIGWSDRLGSGVRNIFKYSKYYSGEEPEFVEGDVFRIIMPLNEDYSYDNPQNDSIDELERKNEEKLEKNQKRFGESSEKNRRKIR
ncbi:ATP-binding protein [Anaerostipes hadrus]|uniref:ATP-binding protein n=1 Tax=Anaerostipes hadrus TaxID=649756 RepID=UPI0032BF6EE0